MENTGCNTHPEMSPRMMRWICISCGNHLLCPLCITDPKHANHKIIEASTLLVDSIQRSNKLLAGIKENLKDLDIHIQAEKDNQQLLLECFNVFKNNLILLVEQHLVKPIMEAQSLVIERKKKMKDNLKNKYEILIKKINENIQQNSDKLISENYTKLEGNFMNSIFQIEYNTLQEKDIDIKSKGLNIPRILDLNPLLNEVLQTITNHIAKDTWKYKNTVNNTLVKVDSNFLKFYYIDEEKRDIKKISGLPRFGEEYFYTKTNSALYISTESKGFFEIILREKLHATRKQDMLVPRENFKLVTVNNAYIYVLGGEHKSKPISKCERFNIAQDKWFRIPDLCEARYQANAFVFNHYIYVSGGNVGSKKMICSTEILDTLEEVKGWDLVALKENHTFPKLYNCGTIQDSPTTVLIFGGRNFSSRLKTCCIFDSLSKTIEKTIKNMKYDDSFLCVPLFLKATFYSGYFPQPMPN